MKLVKFLPGFNGDTAVSIQPVFKLQKSIDVLSRIDSGRLNKKGRGCQGEMGNSYIVMRSAYVGWRSQYSVSSIQYPVKPPNNLSSARASRDYTGQA